MCLPADNGADLRTGTLPTAMTPLSRQALRRSAPGLLAVAVASSCSVAAPPSQRADEVASPAAPSGALAGSSYATDQPSQAPTPAPTAAIATISETVVSLEPGESRDVPVTLEGATEGYLMVIGERMDELSATVDGQAFARGPDEFPIMSATLRGQGDAVVTLVNEGPQIMGAVLTVQALTARILTVTLDSSVMASEPVTVEVTLTEATAEDRPTMTLRPADGEATPVALTAVGVGRWEAEIRPPPGATSRVQVAVDGPRPRTAGEFVTVGVAGVSIRPGFRERLTRGPDALASDLILTVTIESQDAIEGTLVATLVDGAGAEVARSHRRTTIAAGRHDYDLVFDGMEIGAHGLPGPYRLVDVRVLGTGLTVVAEAADLGATQASDPRDFEHQAVEFDLNAFAVRTIDADRDGRFEALVVSGRVRLDAAGRYSVQGELFAGDALITDSFAAEDLGSGWNDIEIAFDGGEILAVGVDGPFQVRNVSITGNRREDPNVTGFVSTATSTVDYRAMSFED